MIVSLRPHLVPFVALLVLLTLTAAGSSLPLGPGNLVLALGIAGAKTGVVALYFMELRRSRTQTRIAACVGLLWLTLFLMLVLTDYLTRFPSAILQ
jgi:cytochrome c oxidase subunit 4